MDVWLLLILFVFPISGEMVYDGNEVREVLLGLKNNAIHQRKKCMTVHDVLYYLIVTGLTCSFNIGEYKMLWIFVTFSLW